MSRPAFPLRNPEVAKACRINNRIQPGAHTDRVRCVEGLLSRMGELAARICDSGRHPRYGPSAIHKTKSHTKQHFDLMLWYVLVILLILWALGLGFHVAGSLIHVLLVVALVVLVLQLITGRRV